MRQSDACIFKMVDISELNRHFMASGLLTQEQLLQAEDYALTRGIRIEEALVFLNLIDYETLGQSLAALYETPYNPLLMEPPPDSAKEKVPLKFAERWKIFPVAYKPEENTLTLAVDDPEDQKMVGQLQRILPAPLQLAFTVASGAEIKKAIEVHYKGEVYEPARDLEVPEDFTIVGAKKETEDAPDLEENLQTQRKILLLEPDLDRVRTLKAILRGEGFLEVNWASSPKEVIKVLKEKSFDTLLVNGRHFQPQGSWIREITQKVDPPHISYYYNLAPLLLGHEHSYQQMSEAFISLVVFLVKKSVKNDEEKFEEIRTRARYCRLLALRLNLPPSQVDGAVLAAWLSANRFGMELLGRVVTPYSLDQIVQSQSHGNAAKRIETDILNLVTKYQTVKRSKPEVTRDINQLRRLLNEQPASLNKESTLEVFLQLIRDEAFLRKVDQPTRRVLLVDPAESQESSMVLRLGNDGYELQVVPDARAAVKIIMESGSDLVISEINLPGTEGLKFCRALKDNSTTAHIPFLFLTAEAGERLPTECLAAGADDFLKKPVDIELLSLKIQRMLAAKLPQETKKGVSGSLTEMSLTDIIQSLTAGDKDVEIMLESKGQKAQIYIQQGEITHTCNGNMEGEEAFYSLMTWEEGDFQIVPCADFPTRTIQAPAMSLLMEGARLADEAGDEERE